MQLNVTLLLPAKILGGAERQFINIAKHLVKKKYINLTVIDSTKKIILDELNNDISIKKLILNKEKITIENSIVLTTANYTFCVNSMVILKNCSVKYLFLSHYNWPHVFLSYFLPRPLGSINKKIFFKKYRKSIKKLEKSLIFNDVNLKNFYENFYNVNLKSEIMGLKVDFQKLYINEFNLKKLDNTLFWIGRLDKPASFFAIEKIFNDIAKGKFIDEDFRFHIIGDGTNKSFLKNISKELDIQNKVVFEGNIDYKNIPNKIKNTLVVFAQGSSVYEAIKNGIPVIVFDIFIESHVNSKYLYKFYNERVDGILGKNISELSEIENKSGHDLKKVFEIVKSSKRFQIIDESFVKAETILEEASQSIDNIFKDSSTINHATIYDYFYDIIFFKIRNIILTIKAIVFKIQK